MKYHTIKKTEVFAACMNNEGKFYRETNDGMCTIPDWVENPIDAVKREIGTKEIFDLQDPSYYFGNSNFPNTNVRGCKMVWVHIHVLQTILIPNPAKV